jgi:hypothetical protein
LTATATGSDGSTQAIAGDAKWGSDNPAVATVHPSTGVMTAISAGVATVFLEYQGERGTLVIRVVSNYQAQWLGSYTKTSCSESAELRGHCESLGTGGQFSLTLTQQGATVQGVLILRTLSLPVTGIIISNGSLVLAGSGTASGLTVTLFAWSTQIEGDAMTGAFTYVVNGVLNPLVGAGSATVTNALGGVFGTR